MTSRAAIVPVPGDPFLFRYWIEKYDQYWSGEIDKLYVHINTTAEVAVVNYMLYPISKRKDIEYIYTPHEIPHGEAIKQALERVKEKHIMLIEDDALIFKRGKVSQMFEMLENGQYEVIGSKRGSCSKELIDATNALWNIDNEEGYGDHGTNFWPCFFFCETELLLKTDQHFDSKSYPQDQPIKYLNGYMPREQLYSDTFVNTSLQIHQLVPQSKILYEPQYHSYVSDEEDQTNRRNIFDGRAAWLHIGSLSSGVNGVLKDRNNRSLSKRLVLPPENETLIPNYVYSDMDRQEWTRRVSWWDRFYKTAKPTQEIQEYYDLYGEAIKRVQLAYGIHNKEILKRQAIFATLGL